LGERKKAHPSTPFGAERWAIPHRQSAIPAKDKSLSRKENNVDEVIIEEMEGQDEAGMGSKQIRIRM